MKIFVIVKGFYPCLFIEVLSALYEISDWLVVTVCYVMSLVMCLAISLFTCACIVSKG